MYYAYSVYLEPVGGPRVILDSNVAILADGEYEKFIKSYKMETALKLSKIVVSLNQQNEQIDFLLNRN